MATVAILLVKHQEVFTWLGHMPVLNWCFEQLREVRGVDHIRCVASDKLMAQTKKLLAKADVPVGELPASHADLRRCLLAINFCTPQDTLLIVAPSTPFLSAGKMEACLNAVRTGKYEAATIGRLTDVVLVDKVQGGLPKRLPALLRSVWAIRPDASADKVERWQRTQIVEVGLVESLDVLTSDNLLLAKAVVAAGDN